MVIRGNSRGNARQLSHYLLAKKENEAIRILDVNGQLNPETEDLHRAVFLMGVSAELSKSEKGLYHAQINPAIGEDAAMNDDHWLLAADILGKQLGLEEQSRAIVLHTKKGRTHAHVVWERYSHEQGKMVSDSFSRLAQDRARKEMEATFGQAPTPHRNKHRPELKASLSALWHQTGTGAQFVKAARQNGYIISEGSGRSPYMVVDENGRSYDLTRQLQGVRLKEVRTRLRHETLLGEKDAIALARKNQNDAQERSGGTGKQTLNLTTKIITMQKQFADNGKDMTGKSSQQQPEQQNTQDLFKENKPGVTGQQADKDVKQKFAENKADTGTDKQKDKEKRREAFKQQLQQKPGRDRERGMDID
ncbi:MAG: relaxase [Chitinophagales bacterium]|nr:relaxase [Chitinophagales bacterium]